jgi:SpoIIAA-like
MSSLAPSFTVTRDDARGELHFVTSGLFDRKSMDAFLAEVGKAIGPLLKQKRKLRALGDLRGYVTQTREIGEQMARTLEQAEAVGIERTAIIINSAVLKMQYKRVSEGRNVQIFEDADTALAWLRSPGSVPSG